MSESDDLLRDAIEALEWQEMADSDPDTARRKGYYDQARERRRSVLRRARSNLVPPEPKVAPGSE